MLFAFAFVTLAAAWDRDHAFTYLEDRQAQWAAWKPAQKAGGACISCHTGLSYLVARRVTAAPEPRPVERDLVAGVRSRVLANPPQTMLNDPGAEAILNLLTLSLQRRAPSEPVSEAEQKALDRLWAAQLQSGEGRGTWSWFQNELHPVESEHSAFYAAALAGLALSAYPAPPAAPLAAWREYVEREAPRQPLHNRLAMAAFQPKLAAIRQAALRDLWAAQAADGGWTTASLGPWSPREKAPPDAGSNAYATAWAAFAAQRAGVACSDRRLGRALDWLAAHQDGATGAWPSPSMNKVFPAGSMQAGFMTDAATGWAAAVLIACRP